MRKMFFSVLIFIMILGCGSSSVIVSGDRRPSIHPNKVKIYSSPPSDYDSVGIVRASEPIGFSEQMAYDRAIERIKREAASIGANGVLIKESGERGSGYRGTITSTGQGTASFNAKKSNDEIYIIGDAIYVN